jgi:putative protease
MTKAGKRPPELLAPAGNAESLRLAVYNGADAVYLGAEKFGARAKAGNFTAEALPGAIRFAHLYGVKVYVALNTLIKESEYADYIDCAGYALFCGADALILQSLPLVKAVRKRYPSAVLHASTQMGVHNRRGAKLCEDAGINRIILSRECALADVESIAASTAAEVEFFIHGALCVSFSGGCYMSSFISGNSGNRGRCLQPCREDYTLYAQDTPLYRGPALSVRDLALRTDIRALAGAGVSAFKIEGRMRRPEYTAAAVRYYKKLLAGETPSAEDEYALRAAYDRNGGRGYVFGETDALHAPVRGHNGVLIGKAAAVKPGGIVTVKSAAPLSPGDGFKLTSGGTETGGGSFLRQTGSRTYELKCAGKPAAGNDVRVTTDARLNARLSGFTRKLPVDMAFAAAVGEPPSLTLTYAGKTVTVYAAAPAAAALQNPLTEEDVKTRLAKLNNTVFEAKSINAAVASGLFFPLGEISRMRRNAVEKLESAILSVYPAPVPAPALPEEPPVPALPEEPPYKAAVLTDDAYFVTEAAERYREQNPLFIYKPEDYAPPAVKKFFADINAELRDRLYLYLPAMCFDGDLAVLTEVIRACGIRGVYGNSVFAYRYAAGNRLRLFCGTGMNITNRIEAGFASENAEYYAYSPELSKREAAEIGGGFTFVYGDIPLMNLSMCLHRAVLHGVCGGCIFDKGAVYLKDKTGAVFPVRRYRMPGGCRFALYNGLKLNAGAACKYPLIDVSGMAAANALHVTDFYLKGTGRKKSPAETAGRLLRGVE